MSAVKIFQNNDYIIPFDKISLVTKHPPDRLEIYLIDGSQATLLGNDCKRFLMEFAAATGSAAPAPSQPAP